jgi:hypothetical protein
MDAKDALSEEICNVGQRYKPPDEPFRMGETVSHPLSSSNPVSGNLFG